MMSLRANCGRDGSCGGRLHECAAQASLGRERTKQDSSFSPFGREIAWAYCRTGVGTEFRARVLTSVLKVVMMIFRSMEKD
jgi:hypothetical protein